jgi:hypothetical protein
LQDQHPPFSRLHFRRQGELFSPELVNVAVKTLNGSLDLGGQRRLLVAQPALCGLLFGDLREIKRLVNGEVTAFLSVLSS